MLHIQNQINDAGRSRTPFLFAVDFELTDGFFISDPMAQKDVLFRFHGISNIPARTSPSPTLAQLTKHPPPYNSYKKGFDIVHHGILRGNSFLVNLTMRTPLATNWSFEEIFHYSQAPYCLMVPGQFVCFSPERFVLIDQGIISTNPMKGTIAATMPNAAQYILNSEKETAEHCTIVDLLRNDLSIVANTVEVKRFRYIDNIATNQGDLLQVSSEIAGVLPEDHLRHLGDIIFSMLPAGSVSGAPKIATLKLITEAELQPRGFYTGVCGYFDGEKLDTAVMIRFIGLDQGQKYFASGGGITALSKPEEEYAEMVQKVYLAAKSEK